MSDSSLKRDNKEKNFEPFRACLYMLAAVTLFACLDTSAKLAAHDLPPLEVVWFRFTVQLLLVSAFFHPWRSPEAWKLRSPKIQILRASVQIICTGLNFTALAYLQIAQTLSIQFTGPIFVTLLSVAFLGERVGRYRWTAIIVAFIGVLVITKPGAAPIHWAFGISLLSVIIGGVYSLTTRMLATTESAGSMLLMMAALPAAILTPLMPLLWEWPASWSTWGYLFAVGFFGSIGHYYAILAHKYAPASFLAPIQYAQLLAVLVLGYAVFGDIPTGSTFVGAAILIGSGLFIWYREKTIAKR